MSINNPYLNLNPSHNPSHNLSHNLNLNLNLIAALLLFISCSDNLPILDDLSGKNYKLISQSEFAFNFPGDYKGKIVVAGYIFTNCPDICPLTTNNLRLIQEKINEAGIKNVEFAAISFDPDVDKPAVLKKYAEIRRMDLSNFTFFTGEKNEIESLMKDVGVFAIPGDSVQTSSGNNMIFYIHTDRISLIDSEGRIRKNYLGSQTDTEEVAADIKELSN